VRSEYVESSSFDKAIELYNPTDVTIDLSFYEIRRVVNGRSSWNDASGFTLQGRLEPKSTYVIANDRASSEILSRANLQTGSLIFDGNDAVGLLCDGSVIDSVGS
jgi:predicted extracellular nuclease